MAPTYDYPRKCELNECKQCIVHYTYKYGILVTLGIMSSPYTGCIKTCDCKIYNIL